MSDLSASPTKPTEQRAAPRATTSSTTVAASTAGASAFLSWIFQCIAAHAILMPSPELTTMMAASLYPLGEAIYHRVIRRVSLPENNGAST